MPPQDRIDKTVATAVIVLFLFYPTIVKKMAQSVNCVQIEGVDRLYNDLEEECFTGTHFWVFFFVSLPALLAWAVGIPVFALIMLRRNLDKLKKI